MFRIRMKPICFLLAFVTVSAAGFDFFPPSAGLEYSCVSSRKPCTLQNVVIESESDLARVTFPAITDPLIIESGKIPHFSRKLAEKLVGIIDLAINRLQLVTVYVKPEMTHLEATHNQIDTLLVDDDQSKIYDMVTLDLTGNKLSDVEILSRFTKLRQLTLNENVLEQLSMDIFNGMSELRKLSLNNNQLFTVDTEKPFQLLKLRSLSFAGNKLLDLNVEKWELDSLIELDLSSNKLYLLDGSLEQFKALVDVKISGNFWKCDFLVAINRLERLKFDHDAEGRCKEKDLTDVKQVCCMRDASDILGNSTDGGLFQDKWEELRQLNVSFQQFKDASEQRRQWIGELNEDDDSTLVERIKQLEAEQQKMRDKLNDRDESEAVDEVNELKQVISDHKSTIENLESKQSDLKFELEGIVESLNMLRDTMNEKLETVDEVKDKITEFQTNTNSNEVEVIGRKVNELRATLKNLEGQQLKYHLSSVDLKSQIGTERSRISEVEKHYLKLLEETGTLRDAMGSAERNIHMILKILNEMSSVEF